MGNKKVLMGRGPRLVTHCSTIGWVTKGSGCDYVKIRAADSGKDELSGSSPQRESSFLFYTDLPVGKNCSERRRFIKHIRISTNNIFKGKLNSIHF
jgi:hypothetical protein